MNDLILEAKGILDAPLDDETSRVIRHLIIEVDRLQGTLEIYADPSNWSSCAHTEVETGEYPNVDGFSDTRDIQVELGIDIVWCNNDEGKLYAQKVLKTTDKEISSMNTQLTDALMEIAKLHRYMDLMEVEEYYDDFECPHEHVSKNICDDCGAVRGDKDFNV